MRKIARSVEEKILRCWLEGNSQRQVASEFGVGLATVNMVIDDARKRTPNLDELRGLNVMLRKGDSSVVDAIRGGRLLDKINVLGVSLERLEGFVNIVDKISSERNVEADRFINSAIRLTEIEAKTGKLYHEVVWEFEDKQARVKELDLKVKELDSQRAKIQGELSRANEKLSKTLKELKHTLGTKERLQRLGLEKTATLAEFVGDYELLGFDTQKVQKLAEWRKSLAKIGIDPDGLESFIKRKGTLERQLQEVEAELTEGESSIENIV